MHPDSIPLLEKYLEEHNLVGADERTVVAVLTAQLLNEGCDLDDKPCTCGWYEHTSGEHNVISLLNGKYTIHVPKDFGMGNIPKIDPNGELAAHRYARYSND